VGHERHVEEGLTRIRGDRVFVEKIQDREVPDREHQSMAVDDGAELHRVGLFFDRITAEAKRLPEIGASSIELRSRRSGLLQLEVLNRAAQAVEP
jgi:hypothetical protein